MTVTLLGCRVVVVDFNYFIYSKAAVTDSTVVPSVDIHNVLLGNQYSMRNISH